MTVFYLEPAHQPAAKVLATKEAVYLKGEETQPVHLGNSKTVVATPLITVYAHSSAGENDRLVAKKSATELAASLATQIQNKTEVTDIYLLACEAGLYNEQTQSTYAQAFRNALIAQGFQSTIKVHAAHAPKEAVAMRVRVTSKQGLAGVVRGNADGYVESYYYTDDYSLALDELLDALNEAITTNPHDQTLKRKRTQYQQEKQQASASRQYQCFTFFTSDNCLADLPSRHFTIDETTTPQPVAHERVKIALMNLLYQRMAGFRDTDDYRHDVKKYETRFKEDMAALYEATDVKKTVTEIERKRKPGLLAVSHYHSFITRELLAEYNKLVAEESLSAVTVTTVEQLNREIQLAARPAAADRSPYFARGLAHQTAKPSSATKEALISELTQYIATRQSESIVRTIRHFFGFIFFKLFSLDKSRTYEVKIAAAEELKARLEHSSTCQTSDEFDGYNEDELTAFTEGRLGKIVEKYKEVDAVGDIRQHFPKKPLL